MEKKAQAYSIKLKTRDRIVLLGLVSGPGSVTQQRTVRAILERVGFSDEEQERLKFREIAGGGGQQWDAAADRAVGYEFSAVERALIVRRLQDLNEKEEVQQFHLPLWDAFVGE